MKSLIQILAALVLIFIIYLGWAKYDLKELHAMCDGIKPGTPVTALASILKQHDYAAHWVSGDGIFETKSKTWVYVVPGNSTMGDTVCRISHDKKVVLSAAYEG